MAKKIYIAPQVTAVALETDCTILAVSTDHRFDTLGGDDNKQGIQNFNGDEDVMQRAKGQNIWNSWDD